MEEKKLRSGFTTGTCAACAAKAAAVMLLQREAVECVQVMTPGGTRAELLLHDAERTEHSAVCAVRKDAGDDPDVTDQSLIYASVEYIKDSGDPDMCYRNNHIFLTGGPGVG
ncbi:MAG: cobalt-precorrin-5B (C(1))-methyltransferase, partial [Hungatella sp.]